MMSPWHHHWTRIRLTHMMPLMMSPLPRPTSTQRLTRVWMSMTCIETPLTRVWTVVDQSWLFCIFNPFFILFYFFSFPILLSTNISCFMWKLQKKIKKRKLSTSKNIDPNRIFGYEETDILTFLTSMLRLYFIILAKFDMIINLQCYVMIRVF